MGRVDRACVILLSVAVVVGLQPRLASGQTWRAPRTSWGHPDLQGVWSTATITPLERPAELAGKRFFPRKRSRNTNGRRSSVPIAIDATAGPKRMSRAPTTTSGGTLARAVVPTRRTALIVDPPDGRVPPLTAGGTEAAGRAR